MPPKAICNVARMKKMEPIASPMETTKTLAVLSAAWSHWARVPILGPLAGEGDEFSREPEEEAATGMGGLANRGGPLPAIATSLGGCCS